MPATRAASVHSGSASPTSGPAPWFQESRVPVRETDWYACRHQERIRRTHHLRRHERSKWSWEEEAGRYYGPVSATSDPTTQTGRQSELAVVRFWLDLGLEGLRLDGSPTVRNGTGRTAENLRSRTSFEAIPRRGQGLRESASSRRRTRGRRGPYSARGDECHMLQSS